MRIQISFLLRSLNSRIQPHWKVFSRWGMRRVSKGASYNSDTAEEKWNSSRSSRFSLILIPVSFSAAGSCDKFSKVFVSRFTKLIESKRIHSPDSQGLFHSTKYDSLLAWETYSVFPNRKLPSHWDGAHVVGGKKVLLIDCFAFQSIGYSLFIPRSSIGAGEREKGKTFPPSSSSSLCHTTSSIICLSRQKCAALYPFART